MNNTDALAWAMERLGLGAKSAFKEIVKTPWSAVYELQERSKDVFLKQTPGDLFIEASIIQYLRNVCGVTVIPEVIVENTKHHCFIMKKCGDLSLRDFFNGKLQLPILIDGITNYKKVQESTVHHIDSFLDLGVPDWRLSEIPQYIGQLIADSTFLTQQNISTEQQAKLKDYIPKVKLLCKKLASYKIPDVLSHCDFHDNNILYSKATKSTSIIDLGETSIAHPLFSMAAILRTITLRYKLSSTSSEYKTLQQACFSSWLASQKDSQTIVQLVETLLPVFVILSHHRFVQATCLVALGEIPGMKDRYYKGFVWFLNNMDKHSE